MGCRGYWRQAGKLVVKGAGACLFAAGLSLAAAAQPETRLFNVQIDGKPAGSYQMAISHPDERTVTVSCRANVCVSYLIIKYRYTYQGTEVWREGRLAHLESKTNDDGKQFEVLAQAEAGSLRVRVNGREHTTKSAAWTTTYWQAPAPNSVHGPLDLLDCDTGKNLRGSLQYAGTQQLTLAGEARNCAHYSIRGDVQVDVWYDGRQRLVREVSVEDGHRIVIELARIDH